MDPRTRDERTKPGADGKAVASNRRSSAVLAALLVVALGLVLDGIVGERGLLANRRVRQRLELAQAQCDALKRGNAEASARAKRLRDQDAATIEDLARRELGFIRPGEKLFIVHDVQKEKK